MASPYQYPWVNCKSAIAVSVDSTPLIIYGAANASIFDTIFICNTSGREIFVNLYVLTAGRDVVESPFLEYKLQVLKDTKIDILKGSILIMEPGDILYGYSDFSGNTFDCIAPYRQLLEAA